MNRIKKILLWTKSAIDGKNIIVNQMAISIVIAIFNIIMLSIHFLTGIICIFIISIISIHYAIKISTKIYKNIRMKLVGQNKNENWKEKIGSWLACYGFIIFLLTSGYIILGSIVNVLDIELFIFFSFPMVFAAFSMQVAITIIQLWNRYAVKPLLKQVLKYNSAYIAEISPELRYDLLALEFLSESRDICLKLSNAFPLRYQFSLMNLRILIKKSAAQAVINLLLKQYPFLNQEHNVKSLNKKLIDTKIDLDFVQNRIKDLEKSTLIRYKKIVSLNEVIMANIKILKNNKIHFEEKDQVENKNNELMKELQTLQNSQEIEKSNLEYEKQMIHKIKKQADLLKKQLNEEKEILGRKMAEVKKADTQRYRVELCVKKLIHQLDLPPKDNLLTLELNNSFNVNNAAKAIQEGIENENQYINLLLGDLKKQYNTLNSPELALQIKQQEAYQERLKKNLHYLLEQLQILAHFQKHQYKQNQTIDAVSVVFDNSASLIEKIRNLEKEFKIFK